MIIRLFCFAGHRLEIMLMASYFGAPLQTEDHDRATGTGFGAG